MEIALGFHEVSRTATGTVSIGCDVRRLVSTACQKHPDQSPGPFWVKK